MILCLAACLYSSHWLNHKIQQRLPLSLDKTQVQMQVSIQRRQLKTHYVSLWVRPQYINVINKKYVLPKLQQIRLNWYWRTNEEKQRILDAQSNCQQAQVNAILRAPKQFANWQPFDYEAYLILQEQDSSGYVRQFSCLKKSSSVIDSWRTNLLLHLQNKLPKATFVWVNTLIFGDKHSFDKQQWQLAQATGTVHLLVVSGLHLGLLAGLLSLFMMGVIRLASFAFKRSLYLTSIPLVIAVLGVSALYVYLSGFGVSVQRAWIMLLLLNLYWLSPVKPPPLQGFLIALLLLLWHKPLLHISAGFMYSFAAVGTLLVVFVWRKNSRIEALWLPQWVIFLSMIALSSYWLAPISSASLWANLLAIPYLALVLLPITFLVAIFPYAYLFDIHNMAVELFNAYLNWCLSLPTLEFAPLSLGLLILWLLFLWVLNLNARSSWQILCLSVALLAYAVYAPNKKSGLFVLDVGQGQSLLLSSKESLLVYDVGAAFSDNFNAGEAIVAPAIWQLGFKQIDSLIISHSDNDHAGGVKGLNNLNIKAKQRWLGQPLPNLTGVSCHQQGLDTWHRLDKHIAWRFLQGSSNASSDNDLSCVLQFQWQHLRGLVLGDISSKVEQHLVARYGDSLKSDVLIIAHHGSKSSSSTLLLKTVMPKTAIISAGFNNRFGHPHHSVLVRLKQLGIETYNTALDGQIQLLKNGSIQTYYQRWQPPWRQRLSE